jgi:hypothetical protein
MVEDQLQVSTADNSDSSIVVFEDEKQKKELIGKKFKGPNILIEQPLLKEQEIT